LERDPLSLKSLEIKDALEMGRLGPEIRGVMYDYEKWRFTPEEEQRNPAAYVKKAADLVHAQNLLFLTAPAVNLVTVIAPAESRNRMFETFVAGDCGRRRAVCRRDRYPGARAERDTELCEVCRQAAAQARQANPKVVVLAGISTEPIGQQVTADDILRAVAATAMLWMAIGSTFQSRRNILRLLPNSAGYRNRCVRRLPGNKRAGTVSNN
jgi:hypothetical protein